MVCRGAAVDMERRGIQPKVLQRERAIVVFDLSGSLRVHLSNDNGATEDHN